MPQRYKIFAFLIGVCEHFMNYGLEVPPLQRNGHILNYVLSHSVGQAPGLTAI